ncbi:MAG: response regulator [Anaerolineae bacterium]|nr:response regulator [Anaerolineae bacterium]
MTKSLGLALIIEDDYDASAIFAKALKTVGFEPEIISRGDIALEKLKTVVPAIIVLDLHLPEVIGTDILKWIRKDERLQNTRVIVATADPRTADLIQDEADLVLIKPTTFSQVRDFAARLASRPRKQATPAAPPAEATAAADTSAETKAEAAPDSPAADDTPPAESAPPTNPAEKDTAADKTDQPDSSASAM